MKKLIIDSLSMILCSRTFVFSQSQNQSDSLLKQTIDQAPANQYGVKRIDYGKEVGLNYLWMYSRDGEGESVSYEEHYWVYFSKEDGYMLFRKGIDGFTSSWPILDNIEKDSPITSEISDQSPQSTSPSLIAFDPYKWIAKCW